jgi:hypothetical protein
MKHNTYPGQDDMSASDIISVVAERLSIFAYPTKDDQISLEVNCNDLFVWGCADGEPIPYSQLGYLYYTIENTPGRWGADLWACVRRCEMPQDPIRVSMEAGGIVLDETVLAPNRYWASLKEKDN